MGPAEHFDPVGSCPQWVRGPQADPARLLVATWGQGPGARLGLWPGLCPSLYEEEGVGTDNICFCGGETKALNGRIPRLVGCRQSLGSCPDLAETHLLAHTWPVADCASSLGLFPGGRGW